MKNYSITVDNEAIFLKMEGDVDLYKTYTIFDELKGIFNTKHLDLVMDIGEVDYIDSSGMGMLIEVKNLLENNGKQYKIVNVPETLTKLFKTTALDRILKNNIEYK